MNQYPTFCAACGLEWTQHFLPCDGNPSVYLPPPPTDKERIAALEAERIASQARHLERDTLDEQQATATARLTEELRITSEELEFRLIERDEARAEVAALRAAAERLKNELSRSNEVVIGQFTLMSNLRRNAESVADSLKLSPGGDFLTWEGSTNDRDDLIAAIDPVMALELAAIKARKEEE